MYNDDIYVRCVTAHIHRVIQYLVPRPPKSPSIQITILPISDKVTVYRSTEIYRRIESDVTKMNSAEYKTLRYLTPKLRLAVKDNLVDLSGALFAAELITKENSEEIENACLPKENRAASLVMFVLSKVEQNPASYHTFIKVLRERDLSHYERILHMLEDTYKGTIIITFMHYTN